MNVDGLTLNKYFIVPRDVTAVDVEIANEGFELIVAENEGLQGMGPGGEFISISIFESDPRASSTLVRLTTENPTLLDRATAWIFHVAGKDGRPLYPLPDVRLSHRRRP